MDVRVILLIGGRTETGLEQLGETPFAMLDVLGASLLNRITRRLQQQGVSSIAVISEFDQSPDSSLSPDIRWFNATNGQFWRFAEAVFNDFAQSGSDLIVVQRLGPYVQVEMEKLLQFHLDRQSRVTQVCSANGDGVDLFAISSSRRNDAAFLFRNVLRQFRVQPESYYVNGYENRLETAADFRRLALDSFAGKTGLEPIGMQVKPGVWVGPWARIHPRARVLAPAYIGAHTRVRASAVVTRGSVIERNSEIDCGTVVESSTILPFSYIGAGLDVICSVVGFRRIAHLQRQVEVEISDSRLINMCSTSPSVRTLSDMMSLALLMPKAFWASLRTPRPEIQATTPEPIPDMEPELSTANQDRPGRFATDLMAARRYGNE